MNKNFKRLLYIVSIIILILIIIFVWTGFLKQSALYSYAKKECKTLIFNTDKKAYEVYAGDTVGYIENEQEARKYCISRIINGVPEPSNYFTKLK